MVVLFLFLFFLQDEAALGSIFIAPGTVVQVQNSLEESDLDSDTEGTGTLSVSFSPTKKKKFQKKKKTRTSFLLLSFNNNKIFYGPKKIKPDHLRQRRSIPTLP
jgi:hypothetical protein